MLDFNKTFEELQKMGYPKFQLVSKDSSNMKVRGILDYGIFKSILEANITYYGQVSVCMSLGKQKNITDKFRDAKLDFMWALNRYQNSNNGVFIFSNITYNSESYVALLFNDVNVIRGNDTPIKVRKLIQTAMDWAADSPLSPYINKLGMLLNK